MREAEQDVVGSPSPSLKPRCQQPCLGWMGWAASAYLGRLPQLPLWHGRPVHPGYPLQRGQRSRRVSRGHVVPGRLRDELKAEQEAFLHLSCPTHSFPSRPGACSGQHRALHELEQPFACPSPQPCPGVHRVPRWGARPAQQTHLLVQLLRGLPLSHLCQAFMKGESRRHRFNKNNPELIDILK